MKSAAAKWTGGILGLAALLVLTSPGCPHPPGTVTTVMDRVCLMNDGKQLRIHSRVPIQPWAPYFGTFGSSIQVWRGWQFWNRLVVAGACTNRLPIGESNSATFPILQHGSWVAIYDDAGNYSWVWFR